ncbi:MAG: hypothetical protein O7E56_14835, partial [SAR324 cluster bacterium]|nr:hypothetical protein [SAR324 cluster bacterium]
GKIGKREHRNYLGEELLRCLQIETTPADQRHPKDSAVLAEVAKELKQSVSVTAEDGQKILFRFLERISVLPLVLRPRLASRRMSSAQGFFMPHVEPLSKQPRRSALPPEN